MMNGTHKILAALAATLLLIAGPALAVPVKITFTGDNNITDGGLCDVLDCSTGSTSWSDLGLDASNNLAEWRHSDTLTIDLAPGTYSFAWQVTNDGDGSSINPAALLAEIMWQGNTSSSSSEWYVSSDPTDPASWAAATGYGSNGGANIWTNVRWGTAVDGISGDADWIWGDMNGSPDMYSSLWFRTSITVSGPAVAGLRTTTVSEPSSLALLGLGLLGLGLVARRRGRVQVH